MRVRLCVCAHGLDVGNVVVDMVLVAEVDNAERNRVLLVFLVHERHASSSRYLLHLSLSKFSIFLLGDNTTSLKYWNLWLLDFLPSS